MGGKRLIVSCPKFLTVETLWFRRDRLEPTKKFTQEINGKVYHDCGSQLPCRLFSSVYTSLKLTFEPLKWTREQKKGSGYWDC